MNPKTLLAIYLVAVIHVPSGHAERKVVVHSQLFNLTCNRRYSGDVKPIVIWRINGEALTTSDDRDQFFKVITLATTTFAETAIQQSTLINVVPLPLHSTTNVSCEVLLGGGVRARVNSWTLLVGGYEREAPRIVTPPEGATFVMGTSSTLNCTSIYDVNITWSIDGKPFGEVILFDSLTGGGGGVVSVVAFVALRSHHQRVLKCVIPSAVEGANDSPFGTEVVLSIVYPPFITSGRRKGNPNIFWCEADANPAANISWFGPEDSETAMGNQSWIDYGGNRRRSELMVDPAFATGVGGYTCIASNAYGNSSAMIPLTKNYLAFIVGLPVGVFTFGVMFIVLVFLLLIMQRPCEVPPPDPIYDSTLPEGPLGVTKRLSAFATGTWKRGSWFGSAQHSTMELEAMNRPRLEVPKVDK